MRQSSFQTWFCERYGCASEQYIDQALSRCLYAHARLLAPLIRKYAPYHFARDLQLIKYIGGAREVSDVETELARLRDTDRWHARFWRNTLRLRVSGRKVMILFEELAVAPPGGEGARSDRGLAKRSGNGGV